MHILLAVLSKLNVYWDLLPGQDLNVVCTSCPSNKPHQCEHEISHNVSQQIQEALSVKVASGVKVSMYQQP